MSQKLRVVGIGCDGYEGLSARAVEALSSARRIIGSPRQLRLLADVDLSVRDQEIIQEVIGEVTEENC